MMLLVRSRTGVALVALWVVSFAIVQLMGDLVAPLPSVTGARPEIALVLPSVLAAAIAGVAAAPLLAFERMSHHPVASYVAGLAALIFLLTTLGLLAGASSRLGLSLASVRCLVAYLGIALILASLTGPSGTASAPLCALLLCSVTDRYSGPGTAWAVSDSPDLALWIVPCLFLVAGAVSVVILRRHEPLTSSLPD